MARLRPKPNATPDDLAFGVHPSALALQEGLARRLLYAEGSANPRVATLADKAHAQGLPVEVVAPDRLAELTDGGVHQGVLVRLGPLPTVQIPLAVSVASLALVLDGITDPQNLGAVLRVSVAVAARVSSCPCDEAPR